MRKSPKGSSCVILGRYDLQELEPFCTLYFLPEIFLKQFSLLYLIILQVYSSNVIVAYAPFPRTIRIVPHYIPEL